MNISQTLLPEFDHEMRTTRSVLARVPSADAARYAPPKFETTAGLLEQFDANVARARAALSAAGDEDMRVVWTLRSGAQKILALPRAASYRSFVMSHLIHHRGQLSVYLRLRDVPLPPIYGPTADESNR